MCGMRVIAVKTLLNYAKKYPLASQSIYSWYEEAEAADWKSPNELKDKHRNASVFSAKRVVFNIHGNSFRLIVDIEYRLQIMFIVWFGTHKQYDKINATEISYDEAS
jgi:mRNA-degrading endonuclease HigB of HigAB toxin-antitoxin module